VIEPTGPTAGERWTYRSLAIFLTVIWLGVLSARPLFNPDEGRYAEIPREMLAGGDWVIPHLNGLAYIEKPPLQYWATALSYGLLGPSEFAARLYTALTALATLLVVGVAARRIWNPQASWRAMGVLSGMLMFVALGQLLTLDMSLSFYLTLSLAAFMVAQTEEQPRPWMMLLAWTAAGCGVLTKGVVAAAIPAAVLLLYSAYTRDFTPWRRLKLAWGLPLFLAITVPWHWLAARRLADFLEFFFVHEHLARYLTPVADREESWWFFGGVFLLGSVPWTVSSLRVLGSGWRKEMPATKGKFQPTVFLWIWAVFIGVFFSLSDSKLMPYILPAMPAVALLIAAQPPQTLRRDFLITAVFTVAAGLLLGLASFNWARVIASSDRSAYFMPLARPVGQAALLLVVSGAFVVAGRARGATRAAVFLGAGWCLTWLVLIRAAALLAPVYSGVQLAAALNHADRNAPLYSVGTYDQSLTFYLRRTVTLVAYRGELDYGLRNAPGMEITDVAEFLRRWSVPAQAFAVMEKRMFDDLKSRGVPMRTVAHTVNRVLVARQ
jgi:4-amino-4-deoxy-L-arabinose transferase-like glycosyltransferase